MPVPFLVFTGVCLLSSPASAGAETQQPFSIVSSPKCGAMFALPDVDGREQKLAAQRGHPVVLHFFATWCEPCKAEFGPLQTFFEKRRDQLDVLAVSVGEVPGAVRTFLKQTPVDFTVLLDADRSVTRAWAVEALPTTVILDAKLKPILLATREVDWNSADVGAAIETALASETNSQGADCAKEDLR
ncbi:MAG: TlpA disulfide reductase family protein [Hyphomicrobium sp.]|uniref:TlpA family protein disulfide reductase n=1 Tax=Hyphomicrobium sp. TaxID=82 RepID=UPI0039E26A1A